MIILDERQSSFNSSDFILSIREESWRECDQPMP
jgi:hypothetical protein